MKPFLTLIFLTLFLFQSCDSTKKVGAQNNSSEANSSRDEKDDTAEREKILSDYGFVKAIVKKVDCGFIIEEMDSKKQYYPLTWVVDEYKVEGKVVYVKYNTPANNNNDCKNAKSIIIEEIKLIR